MSIARGLSNAQIAVIEQMVLNEAPGKEIKDRIDSMASCDGWSHRRNVDLVAFMSSEGYYRLAEYLADKIEDN